MTSLRNTNPPSARGSVWRSGAGLLTRGSLLRGLPGLVASGVSAGSASPHSGGTVPDLHRVPSPCSGVEPSLSSCWCRPLLRLWLPVVAWAALIFALSAVPGPRHRSRRLGPRPAQARARRRVRRSSARSSCARSRRPVPALALGVAYAVSDELHQHFVAGADEARRSTSLIDAVGVGDRRASRGGASSDDGRDRPRRARRHAAALARLARRRGAACSTSSGLPEDRIAAAAELDARGAGNWRVLLRALRRGPRARVPAAGGRGERGVARAPGGRHARSSSSPTPRSSSRASRSRQLGAARRVDAGSSRSPPAGATSSSGRGRSCFAA